VTGPRIRAFALVVALLVGGWLVVRGPSTPTAPVPPPPSLRQVWPAAVVADAPGTLADGTQYTPGLYADAKTSIGVAPTPDGTAQRVLVRSGDRVREVLRVGTSRYPRFLGFTASGPDVYFVESTATTTEPLAHRLWRVTLAGDAAAVPLTADTGDGEFSGSEYDLVVQGDRLYWAAAAPGGTGTEVRSVPTAGGAVTVTALDGAYELSAWPWVQTSATARQNGRQELRDLQTGRRITILKSPAETVDCGPLWCRAIVNTSGDTRYDLMHPDGTARRRVGGVDTFPAAAGVALLDRFEVVLQTGTRSAFDSSHAVALYDVTTGRLVTVTGDADQVQARGHLLWWSTGDRQHAIWHALDLAGLAG
jgi:hypothetical protein